jgi:hypothetical protein
LSPKKNLKSFNPKRSLPLAGERGGWGEFRPPYKFWAKSVRIFSKAHRQLIPAAAQKARLEAEGHDVVPKGKKYAVADYQKRLPAL